MKTEQFRKGREEVEKIIGGVEEEIKAKFVPEPDKKIKQAKQIIDGLAIEASGEIQTRSIYNLNMKITHLQVQIDKLPVRKKPLVKRVKKK
ncbi:MAG: hypothetical protein KKE17_11525 [Proteobacteria bacterium]|nr:hypothetical protein [Pseudomonadota bacterium]MBU1710624.1 hypothetical protein [Pseudomonadota bacterium]